MSQRIFSSALLFSLLTTPAIADEFRLTDTGGRAALSGASTGVTSGEALQPIYGSRDAFLYGNIMGSYASDDSFVASPGLGIRTIRDNQLFGTRMFVDYARTANKEHFWTISPGIEWMNPRWDANMNAYIPTQNSKRSGAAFATGTVSFQSGTHNQYNDLLIPYTVIGDGLDTALGYSFAGYEGLRSRVYGGAFYYDLPLNADNIGGVTGGVQLPLADRLSVSFDNSYDNVNEYTVGVKISLSIGANTTTLSDDIRDRTADPVQRHIGMIDNGAGTIAQQATKAERALQYSNVYFLSAAGTGDGTYGNAANLSQATLDLANAQNPGDSRLYLQGGPGANYAVNSSTAGQSTNPNNDFGLVLHDHQDVFGRSADYRTAAANNAQPRILVDGQNNYNGFILSGSENTLSDLTITTAAGYINGTTPTTSTGIIAYNAAGDQTITILNTHISGFADGMYAQNDSNTGTLTINTRYSTFNDNGGDQGIDTIQVRGYNNYGASGLIAVNSAGASNNLVIHADHSEFNNNGALSGIGSGINNNNFSVASGMTVIDNSDTGTATINATHSTFDHNGTLSGLNTYILANEAGSNANSINSAAATGIFASNNSSNNSALTINASNSTFNHNGTLSGDNSLIQAGGAGAGDNVNSATASGIFAFNNTSGSAALDITSVDSEFNGNGALSGDGSTISVLADNMNLGSVSSSATATGIFAFNNTSNAGSMTLDATGSQFDGNGALSGDATSIFAHTTNVNNLNESTVADASGVFALNANNQGNNNGGITIAADDSTFNGNGALSGNSAQIQALDDNGFGSGSASMATATGLAGYNIAAGPLTIDATNSAFNNNAALSGTASNVTASGADSSPFAPSGLFVFNNSAVGGNVFVNALTGSNFDANGADTTGFGLYGYTPNISGTTLINATGATFSGAPQINTNQGISDGTTQWIP